MRNRRRRGDEPTTGLGPDRRAVSAPIGFMLTFAILIALLGVLQVWAVPTWNAQVEHDHHDRVESDLLDLQADLLAVAGSGGDRSRNVRTGVRYPPRSVFLNPPPADGTLRTTDLGEVGFENVGATGETGDFWTGDRREYGTRGLVYAPSYNEYDGAPRTTIEHGVVVSRHGTADLPRTDQRLVRGDRISLVAVDGAFDRSDQRVPVSVSAVSAPTRQVTVEAADPAEPVRIDVPTTLPVDVWAELLAEQYTEAGGHVLAVEDAPGDAVTVVLEAGPTYDLALSKVSLTDDPEREAAAYVTDVEGDGAAVPQGGSRRLVVEVRDRFNAPVAGTDVSATVVSGSGTVTPVRPRTDGDGRAVFRYEAPTDGTGDATVQVDYASSPAPEERVTFDLEVYGAAGPDGSDAAGDGSGGSVGTGGTSEWSPTRQSQTLSVADGLWRGIDGASSLELSDPRFTPLTGTQDVVDRDREYFRLTFAVRADDTTYLVDVTDHSSGLRRDLGGGWSNRRVVVYKRVGDVRYSTVGSADLATARLGPWYRGEQPLDLLAQPTYDGNHPGINELRQFTRQHDDVEIYVAEMDGRVTLTAS